MGWSDRIGSVAPEKFADLVAVRGNPLDDVTLLQHVGFVTKDGMFYKNELAPGRK